MPITYKNPRQRELVNTIIDDVLDKYENQLANDDVIPVLEYVFNNPDYTRLEGEVWGKFIELFITDVYPDLLRYLNKLPDGFFFGSGLTEITIPHNVEKLGNFIFARSDIRTINYEGTESEWYDLLRRSSRGCCVYDKTSPSDPGSSILDIAVVNCSDKNDIYNLNGEQPIEEAMTSKELQFKRNVLKFLREDGFVTFADYLENFHFNFVTSADAGKPFAAAMVPNKGLILVNPHVNADSISMLLRHEAGHQIFKHLDHMFAKLKKMGIDSPSELAYKLTNIAGDYDISNQLYDRDDYIIAKNLRIEDNKQFAGLVTELDFPENPEYWTMDFDQLWDVFVKNYNPDQLNAKAAAQQNPQNPELSDEFIAGWNRLVADYKEGKITKEQLRRYALTH